MVSEVPQEGHKLGTKRDRERQSVIDNQHLKKKVKQ